MTSSIRRLAWADAHLADIPLPSGVMSLTRSLSSGLCRSPIDMRTCELSIAEQRTVMLASNDPPNDKTTLAGCYYFYEK